MENHRQICILRIIGKFIYLGFTLHLYQASLGKWLSVCLRTKWLWVQVLLQSLNLGFSYDSFI